MKYEEAEEIFKTYLRTGIVPYVYELRGASEIAIEAINMALKEIKNDSINPSHN